jgi:hypothetical protein
VTAGTRVEFRIIEGDRGMKACDVRILDDSSAAGVSGGAANGLGSGGSGHQAALQPERRSPADEELLEVFPEHEFVQQITDLLLATAPQLTGAVIIELRSSLLQFARKNGWVE